MIQKVVVVIPAYNNERTLESVFDRIPECLYSRIHSFVVVNDGSTDQTGEKIKTLSKRFSNIVSIAHEKNRGYAQAQKSGYKAALKMDAEIVILLHADGQYAPEELPQLLEPLLNHECDIVQGGRILGGKALRGGMPLYKYLAIRFASIFENLIYGMRLLEFHSGYLLYSRRALETIPFEKLSDTFYFDGEMLFTAHAKGLRIKTLPISTRYAPDLKSGVRPLRYVFDIVCIMTKKMLGRYEF